MKWDMIDAMFDSIYLLCRAVQESNEAKYMMIYISK